MKVRILNNTIRFRISKQELESLSRGGEVHTITRFVTNDLIIFVRVHDGEENIDLKNHKLSLTLSATKIRELHEDESKVSHKFEMNETTVLFEKDFKCLTDRGEDESDLFANPRFSH